HDVHVEAFVFSEHDLLTHLLFPPPIRGLKVHLPLAFIELVVEELDARRPAATAKRTESTTAVTAAAVTAPTPQKPDPAPRPSDSAADHPAGSCLTERPCHELTIIAQPIVIHVHVEPRAGESAAAGGVEQHLVPRRVADAATDARQPIDPVPYVHV